MGWKSWWKDTQGRVRWEIVNFLLVSPIMTTFFSSWIEVLKTAPWWIKGLVFVGVFLLAELIRWLPRLVYSSRPLSVKVPPVWIFMANDPDAEGFATDCMIMLRNETPDTIRDIRIHIRDFDWTVETQGSPLPNEMELPITDPQKTALNPSNELSTKLFSAPLAHQLFGKCAVHASVPECGTFMFPINRKFRGILRISAAEMPAIADEYSFRFEGEKAPFLLSVKRLNWFSRVWQRVRLTSA